MDTAKEPRTLTPAPGRGPAPLVERQLPPLHRPLAYCALAMAVLAVLCGIGLAVDNRTVLGEPAWLKPFKFAVSFGLYSITLAWMLGAVQRWRRTLWWLGTVVAAGFVLPEIVPITIQAARGVRSHFNLETGLDEVLYGVMGGAGYLGWMLTLALGVFLLFQRRTDTALAWAIPLGIAVSVAGMSVGYLMTSPTPEQAQALDDGAQLTVIGAHGVGVSDGGQGVPVTGWATGGGDLRIPHFVGLHALQVLPLIALGLRRLSARFPQVLDSPTRVGLVLVAAFGYAGLGGLLLWQALRGQSLLQPDAATLLAAAVLAAAVAPGAFLLLARRLLAR